MSSVLFIAWITITFTACSLCTCAEFVYSGCQSGKDGCQDCYLTLVKSLLGNDENVFNLTKAYFPPVIDSPDSVIVNYVFSNDTLYETDTWFWATSGVYILHPMVIFPFISLFFGKYRPIYEQEVTVTLDASECFGVSDDYLALLTQRLKVYVQYQTIYPEMEDSYVAVAVNKRTFEQLLSARSVRISAKHVFITCPILVTLFMLLILTIILMLEVRNRTFRHHELNRQGKAAIMSSAVISFNRMLSFIALDVCAVVFTDQIATRYPEVSTIYHDKDNPGELHPILYYIPTVLLLFDTFFLVISVTFVVVSIAVKLSIRKKGDKQKKELMFYLLLPVSVCFVLATLMHAPYMAMAYLSDPKHAASILLYYIIITFSEFGLLELTFGSTLFRKTSCKETDPGIPTKTVERQFFHKAQISTSSKEADCDQPKCYTIAAGIFLPVLLSVLVYGLTVTATLLFYLIPVSESVGTAPSQIVVTYQTAFILVGGYIVYKVIIKKQTSLQRAIRETNAGWKSMPDHEVLTKFYKESINKFKEVAGALKQIGEYTNYKRKMRVMRRPTL